MRWWFELKMIWAAASQTTGRACLLYWRCKAASQYLRRVGLSCNNGEEMLILMKSGDKSISNGESALLRKEWRRREFFRIWPSKSAFSGQLQPPCSSSQCCLVACVKSFVEQLRYSSSNRTSLGALDGASHPEGGDAGHPAADWIKTALPSGQ